MVMEAFPKDSECIQINVIRGITQKCRKQDILDSENEKYHTDFTQGLLSHIFTVLRLMNIFPAAQLC